MYRDWYAYLRYSTAGYTIKNRQRRLLCIKQGKNAETERGYRTVSTTKGRMQASSLRGFGWMMEWVYVEGRKRIKCQNIVMANIKNNDFVEAEI